METTERTTAFEVSIENILEFLPHRFPFLLVDRVIKISGNKDSDRVGRRVHARKNVTYNEPYFPGHFPHKPVMPGVLQIEAMAQAAALLAYYEPTPPKNVAIATVNNAKFRRPVVPGDVLDIFVEIKRERGGLTLFEARIEIENQRVSECELLAKLFE